jgi:hypothetical protein
VPLCLAAARCYDSSIAPTFQNEERLCHVYQSVVTIPGIGEINDFSFEGTSDFEEWVVDFVAGPVLSTQHPQAGPVHAGYLLDVQSVLGDITAAISALGGPPFTISGHSKGAGEAIICTMLLKAAGLSPLATRAFEPPRVGGPELNAYLANDDIVWTRTRNKWGSDLVTLVPAGPLSLIPPSTWLHTGKMTLLTVPDGYNIATKHRIPAVLAAVQALT